MVGFHICRISGISRARASTDPWVRRVCIHWKIAVQPKHIHIMVVPQGHDQDLASIHRFSHCPHTTLLSMIVRIPKYFLLLITHWLTESHGCIPGTLATLLAITFPSWT